MADPRGFLTYAREDNPKRPIEVRRTDWHEVYAPVTDPDVEAETRRQAARCMDCGIPFCHSGTAGCPLGNLIPEWNDFVRLGEWGRAAERLHATNNFPEFTGALCPAPCQEACVLSITEPARVGGDQAGRVVDRGGRLARRPRGPAAARRWPPASASRWWAPGRPGSRPPSSSRAPGTRSRCTSATTASAG